MAPGDVGARVFAVKATTAMLDLTLLFGWIRMLRDHQDWPVAARYGALLAFVLPSYWVAESVRPSSEHLSAIAFWWVLGFVSLGAIRPWALFGAGIALVLTAAFRYPSALLAVGVLMPLVWSMVKHRNGKGLLMLGLGVLSGLVLGGGADWMIYGRPWESFWMYLVFNVFSGLSSETFGSQSAWVYVEYFQRMWGGLYLPVALAAVVFVPLGVLHALKRREPWPWALLLFVGGHLMVSHKEARFMAPVALLVHWAWLQGFATAAPALISHLPSGARLKKVAWLTISLSIAASILMLLRALWGETWRATFNYLELAEVQGAHCAVVSVRMPTSVFLPWRDAKRPVPEPAFGFFPAPRHEASSQAARDGLLIWIQRLPDCRSPGDRFLLQVQRPEEFWVRKGCEILPTGPLKWVPERSWEMWIRRGWVSAPWYSCPVTTLAEFSRQEMRLVLTSGLRRLDDLPSWRISASEFRRWADNLRNPGDPVYFDGTLAD
jgi:hypothetical protein